MYYEFYIDQFMAEQLLIGYLLLALAGALQRKQIKKRRIAAGSIVNAVVAAVCVCLGLPGWMLIGMAAAGAAAFGTRSIRDFVRTQAILALLTCGFGGVLEALTELFHLPLLAGAALATGILRMTGRCRERNDLKQERSAEVILTWESRTEALTGIIDTGNQLKEPLTGRPVSIVDGTSADQLLGTGWEQRRGCYLIPYHSIGTDRGYLRGVTLDAMSVRNQEKEITISHPVIAIYEGQVSAEGCYQIILHPLHAPKK